MAIRRWQRSLAVAVVMAISVAPIAAAAPTSPLCRDGSYRAAHPLICDTGATPGAFPGGGGGGNRGLLERIGDLLGGIF